MAALLSLTAGGTKKYRLHRDAVGTDVQRAEMMQESMITSLKVVLFFFFFCLPLACIPPLGFQENGYSFLKNNNFHL